MRGGNGGREQLIVAETVIVLQRSWRVEPGATRKAVGREWLTRGSNGTGMDMAQEFGGY